ncbi:hypothetical protein [Thermochromatium tepidum]|uniref:Uncharacterized protein n=1 Tax=Thermochromatium tepidum ATCC 43061 TaxID=316276 RepID=A0A6I6DVP7_THETI|nr:hypothetical protein [Thermochromatium tepidum]QGU31561.1 hypothetical protein E6P07_00260 [Thermochromatium tepidum ATCC 43061]
MYWLMLFAGIAVPIMALAQSRFQALEPDYTQGYERSDSPRADQPGVDPGYWVFPDGTRSGPLGSEAPRFGQPPVTETGATPKYRFRGDPPPGEGRSVAPDSDLRFRPLTPRERERQGPTTRWRPTDEERRGALTERPTLFDTLVPGEPGWPDPWNRPP